MSYTPRHEGARVWPSKPRLLIAGLLLVSVPAVITIATNATSAAWVTPVAAGCVVITGGVINRVLAGRPRGVDPDSKPLQLSDLRRGKTQWAAR